MDLTAAIHHCSGCGDVVPLVWNYSRRASVLDLRSPATVHRTSNTVTHTVFWIPPVLPGVYGLFYKMMF